MFIIHLGFSGFPYGNASVQRVRLTFKGLKAAGIQTIVINKISHNSQEKEKSINRFEGIPFINTAYLPYRPASFAARNLNKVSGYFGELFFLFKKRKKIHTAILYSNYFFELPYYWLLSKFLGFKIVLQYVEFFSSIPGRNSFFTKINDRFLDNYFYHFCDGIIAISDFLVQHVQKKSPLLPFIKLPAICDFQDLENISAYRNETQPPYLMYCGSIYYLEVIEFILSVFENLKRNNIYSGRLILVVSGNHSNNWEQLNVKMKNIPYQKEILIKSSIPYEDLLTLYKSADILLIPLRDTIQDNARFPHKIGEYTASQRPILSTNTGELKYYFVDEVSALLADEYSENSYVEKLTNALKSREHLDSIGKEGNIVGMANFDYLKQGIELKKFILKL